MKTLRTKLVALSLLLPFSAAHSNYTLDFDPEGGMLSGRGYDLLQNLVKGDCINLDQVKEYSPSRAQEVQFGFQKIENSRQFSKLLGVNVAGGFSGDALSISGKESFVENVSVNSYNLYIFVNVKVTNSTTTLRNTALVESAYNLLRDKGSDAFSRRCGDAYLASLTTGGEFYGIIEIETKDSSEKRRIEEELSGKYGPYSGKADFRKAIEEINNTNNINVYVYRSGGSGKINIDPDEFINEATSFPEKVKGDAGFVYKATFLNYDTLSLPEETSLLDVQMQTQLLQQLGDMKLTFVSYISDIGYILKHPSQFEHFDSEDLADKLSSLGDLINKVHGAAQTCKSTPDQCLYPTNITSIDINLPKRLELADGSISSKKIAEAEKAEAIAIARMKEAEERERLAEIRLKEQKERIRKTEDLALKIEKEALQLEQEAKKKEEDAKKRIAEAERDAEAARQLQAKAERDAEEARERQRQAQRDIEAFAVGGPAGVITRRILRF